MTRIFQTQKLVDNSLPRHITLYSSSNVPVARKCSSPQSRRSPLPPNDVSIPTANIGPLPSPPVPLPRRRISRTPYYVV